MVLLH
ncbi:hypothetical protein MTR67_002533 [Solanum verrucosum]|jgi:hypothetical protein